MKLTAKTFSPRSPWGLQPPCMSVYANCIRFNKPAAELLNLPSTLAFDFDSLTITQDPEGFEVKISGSWQEFVIHNRSLTRYVLSKLGKSKAIFRITPADDGQAFRMRSERDDFLYADKQEIENMLNPMP